MSREDESTRVASGRVAGGAGAPCPFLKAIIVLLAAAWVALPVCRATAADVPHVAFVAIGFGSDTTAFDVIRDDLRTLGEVEGRTYVPDIDMSDDLDHIPALAAEIVRSHPAVMVPISSSTVLELAKLTNTIPIVVPFVGGDPLAMGITRSIARPSANVTGILGMEGELVGKQLQILGEIVPSLRSCGLLYDSTTSFRGLLLAAAEKASTAKPCKLVPLGVASAMEVGTALDRPEAAGLDGLVVEPSPMILSNRQALIAGEQRHHLPAVHKYSFEVDDGALAGYGSESTENFERAAEYVDRLLHGAKVSELPFEAPRTFTLSLNQKTAASLGLSIPLQLLVNAQHVVQ